ncbi:unnamed protein product [Hyaloperonospora brassicae]|uniref:RxLR effector candidate protein n=1 Tax=Hyaloperonospora brassicae TaxID=162125 RepID=A0AAV0TCR8_HYABA|nr:unnamed protein product [Hyaloperonospora brassicae]
MRVLYLRLFVLAALYGVHGADASLDKPDSFQLRALRAEESHASYATDHHVAPPMKDGEPDEEERGQIWQSIQHLGVETKGLFGFRKQPSRPNTEVAAVAKVMDERGEAMRHSEAEDVENLSPEQLRTIMEAAIKMYRENPELAEANLRAMDAVEKAAQKDAAAHNKPSRRDRVFAPVKKLFTPVTKRFVSRKAKKLQEQQKFEEKVTEILRQTPQSFDKGGLKVEALRKSLRVPAPEQLTTNEAVAQFFATPRAAERFIKVHEYEQYLKSHPS